MTNILVTAMLLTGGSAVVHALTGVPTAAACYLLPVGVVLYTMFGGIKATFLTDYVHTVRFPCETASVRIQLIFGTRLSSWSFS
jgi:Na+/proline symporter